MLAAARRDYGAGLAEGFHLEELNDKFIPRVKTGPGLKHPTPEHLAAQLLRDGFTLLCATPGEFAPTYEGLDHLVQALTETAGAAGRLDASLKHDGFHQPAGT